MVVLFPPLIYCSPHPAQPFTFWNCHSVGQLCSIPLLGWRENIKILFSWRMFFFFMRRGWGGKGGTCCKLFISFQQRSDLFLFSPLPFVPLSPLLFLLPSHICYQCVSLYETCQWHSDSPSVVGWVKLAEYFSNIMSWPGGEVQTCIYL